MVNSLKLRHIGLAIILCGAFIVQSGDKAWAACANPTGSAGDQMYNSTSNVMQFCDGTDWTAMKKGSETQMIISMISSDKTVMPDTLAALAASYQKQIRKYLA